MELYSFSMVEPSDSSCDVSARFEVVLSGLYYRGRCLSPEERTQYTSKKCKSCFRTWTWGWWMVMVGTVGHTRTSYVRTGRSTRYTRTVRPAPYHMRACVRARARACVRKQQFAIDHITSTYTTQAKDLHRSTGGQAIYSP